MLNTQHELQVVQQGEHLLVDARLLHKQLGSKRQFADWVKQKIINSLFKEGQDYFSQKSEKLGVGRKGNEYLITLDMAKHIAMMEDNEVGYQVRCKFIQKEKELRGVSYLPKEANVFKGIKSHSVNGRKMYAFKQFMVTVGYSNKSSGYNYRIGYAGHFVTMGAVCLISQELALQIYHSRRLAATRRVNKQMQPVLPFNFGEPLKLGGANA